MCEEHIGKTRNKLEDLMSTLKEIQAKSVVQLPPREKEGKGKRRPSRRRTTLRREGMHEHEHHQHRLMVPGGSRRRASSFARPQSFGQFSSELVRNGVVMIPEAMQIDIYSESMPEGDLYFIQDLVKVFNCNINTGIEEMIDYDVVDALKKYGFLPKDADDYMNLAAFMIGTVVK